MKKAIYVLILLSAMVLTVYAHPGKTDSAGGHRDRSTGEYHYHHGYSAHSHTDLDGDGKPDCPYDFHDKTNHDSNSSSGITSSNKKPTYVLTPVESFPSPAAAYTKPDSSAQTSVTKEPIIVPIKYFIVLLLVVGILLLFLRSKSRRIQELEQNLQFQSDALQQNIEKNKAEYARLLADQRQQYEKRFTSQRDYYEKALTSHEQSFKSSLSAMDEENKALRHHLHSVLAPVSSGDAYFPSCTLDGVSFLEIDIPDEVYFTKSGVPVSGSVSASRPYGDLTVYVRPKGFVYHCSCYCGSSSTGDPIHAYEAIKTYRPCAKCGKFFGTAPPDWYKSVMRIRRKESRP